MVRGLGLKTKNFKEEDIRENKSREVSVSYIHIYINFECYRLCLNLCVMCSSSSRNIISISTIIGRFLDGTLTTGGYCMSLSRNVSFDKPTYVLICLLETKFHKLTLCHVVDGVREIPTLCVFHTKTRQEFTKVSTLSVFRPPQG